MSEQEQNIELIKKGYEAFNAGDGDTVMSPVPTTTSSGSSRASSAISGTYRGKAGISRV